MASFVVSFTVTKVPLAPLRIYPVPYRAAGILALKGNILFIKDSISVIIQWNSWDDYGPTDVESKPASPGLALLCTSILAYWAWDGEAEQSGLCRPRRPAQLCTPALSALRSKIASSLPLRLPCCSLAEVDAEGHRDEPHGADDEGMFDRRYDGMF